MKAALSRGMVVGLIGGLVGTVVMDLVLAGLFSLVGMPASLTFSFTGDTAAAFFARIGLHVAGGVLLGAAVHYLVGLLLGLLFGVAVSRVDALRLDTLRKGVGLGILYIEVASLPLLASAPLLMEMTSSDIVQWFGLSFLMHLICGAVLGAVARHGLQPAPAPREE